MSLKSAKRWGLDFGNVLVKNIARDKRSSIPKLYENFQKDSDCLGELDRYLLENSSVVPGATLGVKFLTETHGAENVFIVSRAEGLERFCNMRLLIAHRFFIWTGLKPGNVYFVDRREEKAAVCRSLNLEAFADDRGEVLYHLQDIVPNIVWFNSTTSDYREWFMKIRLIPVVDGWSELMELLS